MKIARVAATPLNVPIRLDAAGIEKQTSLSVCLVEIETGDGLTGHGFTAITEEEVVAAAINEVAAGSLIGEDPLAHEKIWEKLYWLLSPRGQTGYASHAIAAIDVALWDLKGKFPAILDHPKYGTAARELYEAARTLLDRIISRTLSYAIVTMTLAGLYALVAVVPTAVVGTGHVPSGLVAGAELLIRLAGVEDQPGDPVRE